MATRAGLYRLKDLVGCRKAAHQIERRSYDRSYSFRAREGHRLLGYPCVQRFKRFEGQIDLYRSFSVHRHQITPLIL